MRIAQEVEIGNSILRLRKSSAGGPGRYPAVHYWERGQRRLKGSLGQSKWEQLGEILMQATR
jgi:hypothetical protein